MSVEWAKVIAAHLVAQCKQYLNSYCGKDTEMIAIPKRRSADEIKGNRRIKPLEAYLDGIDAADEAILPEGSPPG